jgi:hypothetical protein
MTSAPGRETPRDAPVHTASLRVRFASRTDAERAGRALEPDNAGQVAWAVEGSDLVLEASAATVLGLVRTVDDLLGCLRATGLP